MSGEQAPYQEIFADLVRSIMAAQADVMIALRETPLRAISDALINRHFAWLSLAYAEGLNRHLYDGVDNAAPLRTAPLRRRHHLSDDVAETLKLRRPLRLPELNEVDRPSLVQRAPTRISRIIRGTFQESLSNRRFSLIGDRRRGAASIILKSPLSIAVDILSVPEMPGSRAYVLMTLRNYLFEVFRLVPAGLQNVAGSGEFSVQDVEDAVSHIWTSFRPRYESAGDDKLPSEGRQQIDGMLRHFLAARGLLWLRFVRFDACVSFLQAGEIRSPQGHFEYAKSSHLERLPDPAELVNELWGLPVPIRGGDTLFRGGLKLTAQGGLVLGLHGGPGVGKTSVALALGAFLAPFGIPTLFLTGEESKSDLLAKIQALLPDELRRLSFFPSNIDEWLTIQNFKLHGQVELVDDIKNRFEQIRDALEREIPTTGTFGAPKPCRAIIVLDGLHDLLSSTTGDSSSAIRELREFVASCRELKALVVLTTGDDWQGDRALDYLVDVSMRLSYEKDRQGNIRPDRQVMLTKARHQWCAIGAHGLRIAGSKGVRFSPQISYQLERRALWKPRLPDTSANKTVLRRGLKIQEYDSLDLRFRRRRSSPSDTFGGIRFVDLEDSIYLPRGSNIFINGEGSGGKAALALKIATAPAVTSENTPDDEAEKVLVVSFLYPEEYYHNISTRLALIRRYEFPWIKKVYRPTVNVIHLYPGYYKPSNLFNRIEWELDAAELHGRPYTSVIVDGIHNIFLQFPEIENYGLFWPQLFANLRTRDVSIISTHTTFVLQGAPDAMEYRLDDRRSEPLRHSLVQKVDFRLELDPDPQHDWQDGLFPTNSSTTDVFRLKVESAFNQPLPHRPIFWSRDRMIFFASTN